MRVILRDIGGRYFQGLDRWTSYGGEAFDFGGLEDAAELATGLGLKEAEVQLSSKSNDANFASTNSGCAVACMAESDKPEPTGCKSILVVGEDAVFRMKWAGRGPVGGRAETH